MADYHTDNAVFLVYKDWESLFDSLDSNEEAGELIKALFAFAKRGEIAEFSGALKMAFIFMSQQLERDGLKWEETCNKRSESGKKGGRPAKAKESKKTNCFLEKQKKAKEADTDTVTDTEKDTDTVTDKDTVINGDDKSSPTPTNQKRFVKPSLDEVKAYCQERGNSIDAERFIDYYESTGWKVGGKAAMKDWKAAVRNWERRRIDTNSTESYHTPTADEYDFSDWYSKK